MRDVWGWTMNGRPLDLIEASIMGGDHDYRRVAQTWLYTANGVEAEVSTVFLVTNVELDATAMPGNLFETMIFTEAGKVPDPGPVNAVFGIDFGYKAKYATFDDALTGHARHVNLLRGQGFRPALGSA